jgi:O-antigen/teichoic acid export membrane protein
MSARSRLIAGFGAAALGPAVTALLQAVSIPVFLQTWGPRLFGEWLILSAVPTYLAMTDMGFGSVAGNDMAMRVAVSDRSGALETFQSTWLLVNLISLTVLILSCGIIFAAPVTKWLHLTSVSAGEARFTLVFLSIYCLCTLQASVLQSAFRADGLFAFGTAGINTIRLFENTAMLLLLLFNGHPLAVAIAAATVRGIGTIALFFLLGYKLPWIRFGFAHASRRRLQELTRPAIAFMAFPAGLALSIQGMTILVGMMLGPIAVATFSPMRTLSRFAYQILDQIKSAVWAELSSAYGARNWHLARRLHRSCCQVAFWLASVSVAALAIWGPAFFRVWTRHRVVMNLPCFYLLLLVVVASSLWNTSSAVSIAANLHERLAVRYLIGTGGSLILAYLLLPHIGIAGAALGLLASDIWMACSVIPRSNDLLFDSTSDFVGSMFSLSRFKLIIAR